MSRLTCPACSRRTAGVIDPECLICEGVGVLQLGAAALHRYSATVAARGVALYLEAASREVLADTPPGPHQAHDLAAAVTRLRDLGIITAPVGVSEPVGSERGETEHPRIIDAEASQLAADLGAHLRPSDRTNLSADPVQYSPDDRPRATGLLPRTSAAGHPSALARVVDPTDPLGPDTRLRVYEQQSVERQAVVLTRAIDRAHDTRVRAARRARA